MSLYRREGSPFWWFDFTVGGVRFRGSSGEEGKREAREAERKAIAAAKEAGAKRGRWKLRHALGAYWSDHAERLRSSATISHQLEKLSEYLGPNILLTAITPAMLTLYHRRRVLDGLKEHSVNREIVILRAALQHAQSIHGQQMPDIQWAKVRKPEPPGRTRFLSREEYDALMRAAHEGLRPIILCAVTTGLREGNILEMDWQQVKLGERLIQMRVKGNKEHAVRITPALLAALSTMPLREGLVFDRTNFRRRWASALKRSGLVDLKFHDLRHTFASWARQAGADIADVCEALGHSDISMTMRYAHIKPDAHDTAFDRVSAAMMAQSTSQVERKA